MTGGTELYSLSTLHAPEILFLLVVHSIEIQAQLILFSDIQTIYAASHAIGFLHTMVSANLQLRQFFFLFSVTAEHRHPRRNNCVFCL